METDQNVQADNTAQQQGVLMGMHNTAFNYLSSKLYSYDGVYSYYYKHPPTN